MLVRRSVDGHDFGNIEFHISNFRYPVLGEYERINVGRIRENQCWANTREACKTRGVVECFTRFSNILPTFPEYIIAI
jgi:hypothetical protein